MSLKRMIWLQPRPDSDSGIRWFESIRDCQSRRPLSCGRPKRTKPAFRRAFFCAR